MPDDNLKIVEVLSSKIYRCCGCETIGKGLILCNEISPKTGYRIVPINLG